jgi:outer membrane immunogenic protein
MVDFPMFSGAAMKNLATAIAIAGLIGSPAFSADMAVKAPPSAPAPAPYTWTGFYAGIQFGGGWSHEAVNYSANDPASALLLSGGFTMTSQPVASGYRIPQSVLVGGFEAGYNWQWSNWLLGVETDFSFAGMSGQARYVGRKHNFGAYSLPNDQRTARTQIGLAPFAAASCSLK